MIKFLLVFSFFIFSFPGLASQAIHTSKTLTIPKSPNDKREYAAITLDNKLEVILISDPSSDKASAALDVYVGSSDDPKEFLGLAHFLEHMLFLGTKKYPNPDEYQKFISNHGGAHNAFTSLNHTNYFFDIQPDFLEEALDRFSQQFTSPLFNEEYVEREVNAVHSEYTAKIKDDGRRFFSAMKAALSDDHPYSKFSVGNLETLKSTDEKSLRDALLDFYDQHYSANRMKLVILGKQPIATLKKWTIEKFSNIPNTNIQKPYIEQAFFNINDLPGQLNVQTIMDKRSLTIAFPIPSESSFVASKPIYYLSNLIGHEGKGSLLSKLKEMGLVDSLSAGSEFDTQVNALFMINMSLTEKGLDNYEGILNIVFDYLALLKEEGIKKLYFDEQAQLLDIAFKYQEKSEPIHLTSSLAMALHETKAQDILLESYQLTEFNPEVYSHFLDHLTPSNMFIALSAQDLETNQKTEWYQTPYAFFKLDQAFIKQLENIEENPTLFMPYANQFIPDDTTLLNKSKHKPQPLIKSEGFDVWYAFDSSFGTPKSNIFLTLRSPISNHSADNFNQTDILVSLLKDSINEYSYPAFLAGLHFELYQHMRGITVKISGYNDKQSSLLIKIIKALHSAKFTNERFDTIKERLQRQLENASDKKPFQQAIARAQNLLISPSWSETERLEALTSLTFDKLNEYRKTFLQELEAVLFVNGNVTRASALNIANLVNAFVLKDTTKTHVEKARINKLEGELIWSSAINVDHEDTGFVYYLQGDNKSIEEQAKFMLLNQIISTDFYGEIRTDKQLGYIVFSTNFTILDVPAIAFIVQSPNTNSEMLLSETRQFLERQVTQIQTLTASDLERFKSAVTSKLLKKDNTLYSRSNRYWKDIDRENFNFDSNEKLAEAISNINVEDLSLLIKKLISNNGKSLLSYSFNLENTLNYEALGLKNLTEEEQNKLSQFK